MILFDQLRISDDAKQLYINVHVNDASYFANVYLDSITIMTADKVSELHPETPTSDYIYKVDLTDSNRKTVELVLSASDFLKYWEKDAQSMKFSQADMSNTLFFVYVKVRGIPAANTPCDMDREVTVGVTYDEKMLYRQVMQLTHELNEHCEIPKNFIDLILLWHGFRAAVETGHFLKATDFWKRLIGGRSSKIASYGTFKPCGCHG